MGRPILQRATTITDNLKLTLKVINLFDEESRSSHVSHDSRYVNETSAYGRRISFGLRAAYFKQQRYQT